METRSTAAWSSAELLSHSSWIRSLALRLVRDAAQADDLVQETFLAALQKRPSGERPLRPWLGSVLRRRAAFLGRGDARRRAREESRPAPDPMPSSEELLERAELHGEIVRALAHLRDPYRTALLLRYYEDLPPREIARRQGLPAATVRSHLRRGLDELRAELDRKFEGDRRRWALAAVALAARADGPGRGLAVALKVAAVLALLALPVAWLATRAGAGTRAGETATAPLAARGAFASEPLAPVGGAGAPRQALAGAEPAADPAAPPAGAGSQNEGGAPMQGTVRDLRTGAPLPYFALRIRRDEDADAELVWTDEAGRFESARRYPAGSYPVSLLDHPDLDGLAQYGGGTVTFAEGLALTLSWDPEGAPLELRTMVGPTYPLAIAAPFAWELVPLRGSLRAADGAPYEPRPMTWSVRAPVRETALAEARAWIRFQPLYGGLPGDRAWRLSIETLDGLWSGSAEVDPGEGVYAETVAIVLEPRAALEVELVAAAALDDPAVTLEDAAQGTRRALFAAEEPRRLADGGLGYGFEVSAVPPGEYRVLVRANGVETARATVLLPAGEVTRREIEVRAEPPSAHVRGELASETGRFDEAMTIQLVGPDRLFVERPQWTLRDGRRVAPFAFENLPVGEYEVRLLSERSNRRWSPYPLSVAPPESGLVLTCRDGEPVRDLFLRASRAEPGPAGAFRPIVATLTVVGSPAPTTLTSTVAGNGATTASYADVPVDAELDWYVWAEDCAPRAGDERSVTAQGEVLVLDVVLDPGWGARVHATGPDRRPLAGVEVRLDGELAGTTDAEGELVLSCGAAPGRVDLGLDGHRFDGGDYDPHTGRLTGEYGTHVVRFAPAE